MSKKIAVIASSIHPIRQKHLLEWYEDLLFVNLKTQLFLGSKSKSIPNALNYKVNTKEEKLKYAALNLFNFQKQTPELKKIQPLIDYSPNVIHLLTSNAFQNVEPLLEEKSIKLIVSFRGFDINVFPNQSEENRILTQRIFEKADILHFISENLKNTAIKMNADPEKCLVIHRSIRINKKKDISIASIENKKLIIISVGRLVWEKGYLYALETIAILKSKGYEFEYQIAGKGIDYNMLVFHIERLNIRDCVTFLGELTTKEVQEKLIAADIYFQPSLSEALSLAILEASYYKLPIVSSKTGGIPEIVKNNVSGLLTEPCIPKEYAKSIIKLINDKDLRIKMGDAAHINIIEKFSRKEEIDKWTKLYKNTNER